MTVAAEPSRASTPGAEPTEPSASSPRSSRRRAGAGDERGYEAQREALAPDANGFERQREALKPGGGGATDAAEERFDKSAKASAELEVDLTPAAMEQAIADADARLAEWERKLSQVAHETMGASAPNKIGLGIEGKVGGAIGTEKEAGKEASTQMSASASVEVKGEVGWELTSADVLTVAELGDDALTFDRDYALGTESGTASIAASAGLFVGAKVEGKAEIASAEAVDDALASLMVLLGKGAAEAGAERTKKASGEVASDADAGGDPMPKIAKDKEKQPKSEVELGSASLSGKAFVGAELTVGAEGTASWAKREAPDYAHALAGTASMILAFNPATAPFAVPVATLLAVRPDLMVQLAPTLMGAAGDVNLLTAKASVTGTAGASAEGELKAAFTNGRVSFTASGEAAVGFGGGADVSVDADPVELMRFGAAVGGAAAAELTGAVEDEVAALADKASELWDSVVESCASNLQLLGQMITWAGDEAAAMIVAMWDGLVDAGADAYDLVVTALGSVSSDVATILERVWDESWAFIAKVWSHLTSRAHREAMFEFVRSQSLGALGTLLREANGNLESLCWWIWDALPMEDMADVVAEAGGEIERLCRYVWHKASYSQLGRLLDAMSDPTDYLDAVWEIISWEQVGKLVASVTGSIGDVLDYVWEAASLGEMWDVVDAAWDFGVSAADELEAWVDEQLGLF